MKHGQFVSFVRSEIELLEMGVQNTTNLPNRASSPSDIARLKVARDTLTSLRNWFSQLERGAFDNQDIGQIRALFDSKAYLVASNLWPATKFRSA